jgi:hypothetical protein
MGGSQSLSVLQINDVKYLYNLRTFIGDLINKYSGSINLQYSYDDTTYRTSESFKANNFIFTKDNKNITCSVELALTTTNKLFIDNIAFLDVLGVLSYSKLLTITTLPSSNDTSGYHFGIKLSGYKSDIIAFLVYVDIQLTQQLGLA